MKDPTLSNSLKIAFFFGLFWDFTTTFFGVIAIIAGSQFDLRNPGSNFGVLGIAAIATLMVFVFNIMTPNILEAVKEENQLILVPFWLAAILFDFYTSFAGNYKFVSLSKQNDFSVMAVILFVTILTTISPMALRYLIINDKK
jgi:hypothetical protein